MPPKKTSVTQSRGSRKSQVKRKPSSRPKSPVYESDDSVDSSEPRSHKKILGAHNTLKQLFSGQSSQQKPETITPPRKTVRSGASKISLSPINSASTPISRLINVKANLGLSQDTSNQPVRFDDIEIDLPPPKKRRPGRPSKQLSPTKAKSSVKTTASRRQKTQARKTPRIEEFPEEDDSYMELKVPHPENDMTGDLDILPPNTRRSSYNNRGKRGSSIGNGFVAKPHPDVSERDYVKLLDSSMSEPNRMRQLLSWCFRKTIETKKTDGNDSSGEAQTAEGIAKAIEKELLEQIINGTVSTSWYSMDEAGPDGAHETKNVPGRTIIRPNPLNEANKESIEVFKNKLRSLRAEKAKLLEAYDSRVKAIDEFSLSATPMSEDDIRDYLRRSQSTQKLPETILDNLVPTEILSLVNQARESVENRLQVNVEKFHHLSHGMRQSAILASAFDSTGFRPAFATLVQKYVHRNDENQEPSTKELLQGIAKLDRKERSR